MTTIAELLVKKCRHQQDALSDAQAKEYLALLPELGTEGRPRDPQLRFQELL